MKWRRKREGNGMSGLVAYVNVSVHAEKYRFWMGMLVFARGFAVFLQIFINDLTVRKQLLG